MSILSIHNLAAAYRRKPVLREITLSIDQPALVGIVGPNGAGKSTLIKAILGLIPSTGDVRLFDQPLAKVRKRIGYVPQRESVDWDFPVRVLDVVLMGTYGSLGWFRRPGSKEKERSRECLAAVGMADLERRQIGELSGGQQQRTFLARALAQDADLYFMDEPMAGVDAATERVIFDLLKSLRQRGKTVIAVHHDLRTVPQVFERVVLLNETIIAEGPTNEFFTDANLDRTYGRL